MALTLEQFVSNLQRSGLLGQAQLEAIRSEVGEGSHPDPPAVVAALQSRGVLTTWQADKLLAGVDKGFILGKHKLLRLVASSSMSTVYEAEHVLLHRRVALKVLPKALVGDGSFLERFYREARAVARLDHPNIIRGFDVGQEGDYHYLVMEFVEGSSLQQLGEANGPIPFDEAAELIRQAAVGLEHAHRAGLVHRDIKPANLLRDHEGTVKVLDLGLVRSLPHETDGEAGLTRVHDEGMLGTVDYLSPEQAIDSHNVDIRSDIYSLGCTFYFLLAGSPPFSKGTLAERLLAHQSQAPVPLAVPRPDIPDRLAQVVARMLAKRPVDRYQSPGEVAAALGDWLERRRESPAVPDDEAGPLARSPRATGRAKVARKPGPGTQAATALEEEGVSPARPNSPSGPRPVPGPVGRPDGLPEAGQALRPLVESWERWASVVEGLGRSGDSGPRVSEASYQSIYQELLQACRASSEDADEPTRLTLRKIEDLAAPWPTLRSLRSILRSEMNAGILEQFDEIDRILRAPRKPFLSGQALAILVVFVGALAMILSLFS